MGAKENQQEDNRSINILVQYVKDVSFENPNAPMSLQPSEVKPNINVSVDVLAKKLSDNQFEVELKIGAQAKRDEEIMFISEVSYAGIFRLEGIPDNELQPVLLIFCPAILFPFSRRIVADLTRDGGFPPLLLDPIDFGKLYQQKSESQKK
ncbi:MAG TPA: protein-export chaperone SecB [Alphaproteobacteria bacterium]|nr:protein-export chaperone SecB [Alphaproteobacteria bacterium]